MATSKLFLTITLILALSHVSQQQKIRLPGTEIFSRFANTIGEYLTGGNRARQLKSEHEENCKNNITATWDDIYNFIQKDITTITPQEVAAAAIRVLARGYSTTHACRLFINDIEIKYEKEGNLTRSCGHAIIDSFNSSLITIHDLAYSEYKYLIIYGANIFAGLKHFTSNCTNVDPAPDMYEVFRGAIDSFNVFPIPENCTNVIYDVFSNFVDVAYKNDDWDFIIQRIQNFIRTFPKMIDTCDPYQAGSVPQKDADLVADALGQIYQNVKDIFTPEPPYVPTHIINSSDCTTNISASYDFIMSFNAPQSVPELVSQVSDILRDGKNTYTTCKHFYLEVNAKYVEDTNVTHKCEAALYDFINATYTLAAPLFTQADMIDPVLLITTDLSSASIILYNECKDGPLTVLQVWLDVATRFIAEFPTSKRCKTDILNFAQHAQEVFANINNPNQLILKLMSAIADVQDFWSNCVPQ